MRFTPPSFCIAAGVDFAGSGGGGDGRLSFPPFGSAFADFGAGLLAAFFGGGPFFMGFFAGAALFVFFFGVAIIKDFGYSGYK